MIISDNGLNLIKRYEGLKLNAYKPVSSETYYTIGYGHYGPDVKAGMTITEDQATAYLRQDVKKAENKVNSYNYNYNQNQFDALVSFTYNCGVGNFTKLTNSGKRSLEEIGEKLLAYNKAGGKVLAGLTRRRKEEHDLFFKAAAEPVKDTDDVVFVKHTREQYIRVVNVQTSLNIRKGPSTLTQVVGVLKNGNERKLKGTSGNWYKIPEGYVHRKYCQIFNK